MQIRTICLMTAAICGLALPGFNVAQANNTSEPKISRVEARQIAKAQKQLEGKIAQAPVRCAPRSSSNMMRASDSSFVLRQSGNTAYKLGVRNSCARTFDSGDIIVRRNAYNLDYCEGDVLEFVDRFSGGYNGFCVIDSVTPYKVRDSG